MRPRAESVPGDGYDAGEGPDDEGLASESVDLSEILENAEADSDPLAVAPEDLGRRALREAAQQDEPAALDASFLDDLDEEESLEARTLLDTDDSDIDSPGESRMEPAAVDLTENAIQDGSIFDQPRAGEMGQVRRPLIKTNEVDETLERNERARRASRSQRIRK
jgi:hypothetical protein